MDMKEAKKDFVPPPDLFGGRLPAFVLPRDDYLDVLERIVTPSFSWRPPKSAATRRRWDEMLRYPVDPRGLDQVAKARGLFPDPLVLRDGQTIGGLLDRGFRKVSQLPTQDPRRDSRAGITALRARLEKRANRNEVRKILGGPTSGVGARLRQALRETILLAIDGNVQAGSKLP